MLRDIHFRKSYRTDRDDISSDFLSPALGQADFYDRATGYFTSSILRSISIGLASFVSRDGYMRLVASPHLKDVDIEAIRTGYAEREATITRSLLEVVEDLEALLAREDYATQMLTWLIARHRLAIKIAFPINSRSGIFHEKIGIIKDSEESVAFTGSFNETGAAAFTNFESIDVFTSWQDRVRVAEKTTDFELLWQNTTNGLEVLDFPKALKERLIVASPVSMPAPPLESQSLKGAAYALRDYQNAAIAAWKLNGRRGILDMATGTGKTKTALAAITDCLEAGTRAVIVLAPLKHLVDEWAKQLSEVVDTEVVRCFSEFDWRAEMGRAASRARVFGSNRSALIIATTYSTAQLPEFLDASRDLPHPSLIVADEVHNVTPSAAPSILQSANDYRLGLSATPSRYEDEAGTEIIQEYFGGIVYQFDIKDAIKAGYLTAYDYFPIFCRLTEVEALEYELLKKQIAEAQSDSGTAKGRLIEILAQRQSLVQTAADKLAQFEILIRGHDFDKEGFNLVYCHPQLINVVQDLLGNELHYKTHTFTARESLEERKLILERFGRGDLRFMTAIRCLDEGVDVPATRTAFLLNSSKNPKEFIQRRGRVLRLSPGKDVAQIYDFVVLPDFVDARDEALVKKELARFYEFAETARNRNLAMSQLEQKAFEIGLTLTRSLT